MLKEKQCQVQKEEENLKRDNMHKSKDEGGNDAVPVAVVDNNNWMSGRQEIHQIERREIWIQQAEVFIKQVCK